MPSFLRPIIRRIDFDEEKRAGENIERKVFLRVAGNIFKWYNGKGKRKEAIVVANNKRINVRMRSVGIEDYDFEYDQPAGEQVYERFILVKDDKVLQKIEVSCVLDGEKVPFEKFETEDNEIENYRDVLFYPSEDVIIEAFYESSPDRVAFRLDLSAIRHLLSATSITKLPSPVSFFYSDSDEIHDYTNIFDEDKTYYYDDCEGVSFIVRLSSPVDLRISMAGKEYLPEEKEECFFHEQKVYEYRFGTIDDLDVNRVHYKRLVMRAPETIAKFIVGETR